ncbi:MAG: 4-(cytidine 5'-diphospho)-2-C-methyl-D-erythritol kinase [Candidatus Omnitrophica bacterium]|nr:4-(cytidine 5'-diphospho)-2-C-methyl-D-erythritol kinase [Candidatus Omnitrophota bacterium]
MREIRIFAPAKLNLYLDVLDKRPDGYHNIKTLFEKIDLKDEIIIKEGAAGLDVKVEPASACPSGKENIVYKALQALFKEAGVEPGIEVTVKKKIPVSAGLGGGSSDAAAVLRSVNEAFGLGVSFERLFSIAVETGKDVPFFMLDAPFAIGTGAGEALEPIKTDASFSHVIIRPDAHVSTAEMYKRLDGFAGNPQKHSIEDIVSAVKKKDPDLLERSYFNIFEYVLADHSKYVDRAKDLLLKAGSRPCFLSGSGPSVFCTVEDREEAVKILKGIPEEQGIDIFLATTQMSPGQPLL